MLLASPVPVSMRSAVSASGWLDGGASRYWRGRLARHRLASLTLSAFAFPSLSSRVASIARGLPFSVEHRFPLGPRGEFRVTGLLLGFEGSGPSGRFGRLRFGKDRRVARFPSDLGSLTLGDTDCAGRLDRLAINTPLDGGGTLGLDPCSGGSLQLRLLRLGGGGHTLREAGLF